MRKRLRFVGVLVAVVSCGAFRARGDDDRDRLELVRRGTALAKLIEEAENHPLCAWSR